MNTKAQRVVFWAGLFGFVLLSLFPPWHGVGRGSRGEAVSSVSLCNSFIFDPPEKPKSVIGIPSVEIDTTKLFIEYLCLSVLTAGVIVGLGFGQKDKTNAVGLRD